MVAAVTGAFVIVTAVGSRDALLRGTVNVGSMLGLGATAMFIALHLIGFAYSASSVGACSAGSVVDTRQNG